MECCRTMSTEEILALPDVQERIAVYREQDEKFREMVKAHTRVEKDVIISDLRGVDPIYSGNRFLIYSMYPEQNISVWIVNGRGGMGCSAAVGYSILNRTSHVNVGSLMLKYGGGGHMASAPASSPMRPWMNNCRSCLMNLSIMMRITPKNNLLRGLG